MSERPKPFAKLRHKIEVAKNVGYSLNYARDVDPQDYDTYVLKRHRERLGRNVSEQMQKYVPKLDSYGNPSSILDIAAGTGIISKALLDAGYQITATDLSGESLKMIYQRSTAIAAVKSNMNEDFPFTDNTFHGITSVWANRFITNSDHFLSECYRVLQPDGILIWPIFWTESRLWRHLQKRDQHTSLSSLSEDAKRVGFGKVETIKPNYSRNLVKGDIPILGTPGYIIAKKPA